jgi:hypothetical protein
MRPRFIIIIMAVLPFVRPWPLFFSWSHTQSVGLLWRGISPSQVSYLHTEQHKHRLNAHKHQCPWVGFERTTSVLKRAKTVHALDRSATAIGRTWFRPTVVLPCLNTSEIYGHEVRRCGGYAKEIFNPKRGSFPTTGVDALHAEKWISQIKCCLSLLSCRRQKKRIKWWVQTLICERLENFIHLMRNCRGILGNC